VRCVAVCGVLVPGGAWLCVCLCVCVAVCVCVRCAGGSSWCPVAMCPLTPAAPARPQHAHAHTRRFQQFPPGHYYDSKAGEFTRYYNPQFYLDFEAQPPRCPSTPYDPTVRCARAAAGSLCSPCVCSRVCTCVWCVCVYTVTAHAPRHSITVHDARTTRRRRCVRRSRRRCASA
jgi:hypothetical protein